MLPTLYVHIEEHVLVYTYNNNNNNNNNNSNTSATCRGKMRWAISLLASAFFNFILKKHGALSNTYAWTRMDWRWACCRTSTWTICLWSSSPRCIPRPRAGLATAARISPFCRNRTYQWARRTTSRRYYDYRLRPTVGVHTRAKVSTWPTDDATVGTV